MSGFKRYQTFGGKVVLVQKIKGFEFDRVDATATVVLEDGTKRTRPLVHGFAPQIGDFYVMESTTDHQYAPAEIVQRGKLSQYFVEVPENLPPRSGRTAQFYKPDGTANVESQALVPPDPFAGVELVEPKPRVYDNSRAAAILNAPYDLSKLPPEGDPYTAFGVKVAEAADSKQEKPE